MGVNEGQFPGSKTASIWSAYLTSAGGEEVLPAVLLALVDDAALLLAGVWLGCFR
jgi:hypothetical protein